MTFKVGRVLMMLKLGSGVLLSNEGDGLELGVGVEVAVIEVDGVEADGVEADGVEADGVGLTEAFAVEPWVELGVGVSV